jgi:hypothetical protein
MKHVTQIVEREGRVGPDFEMLVPVSDRSDTGPANILRILVDRIDIEKRIRAMSEEVVEALREDISKQGLLHPIGVKRSGKGDGRYVLIYGRHRLEAFQRGWTAAQRLLDERGDKNPEALKQAQIWQSIPCVVYSEELPAGYAMLKELGENLFGTNLRPEEREIHRAKYAVLLRKLGKVRAQSIGRPSKQSKLATHLVISGTEATLPTVREKAAKDLGVTSETIRKDHKSVENLANATRREFNLPPITVTPDSPIKTVEMAIDFAQMTLDTREEARKKGTDPRKAAPVQVQGEQVIILRIDLTDPAKLAGWLTSRVDKAKKPLTLDFIDSLAKELTTFVRERRSAEKENKRQAKAAKRAGSA